MPIQSYRACALVGLLIASVDPDTLAQITVESADLFPAPTGTFTVTSYNVPLTNPSAVQAITAATGPNQVYDFTVFGDIVGGPSTLEVAGSAVGTPGEGDPLFDTANYVTLPTPAAQIWTYFDLSSSAFRALGTITVLDSNGDSVLDTTITKNSPANITFQFPINFGDAWQENLVVNTASILGTSEQTIAASYDADAWGELRTPVGNAEVVRMKETRTTTSSGVDFTVDVICFLSKTGLQANIIVDEAGNIFGVSYSKSETGMSIDDDPTSGVTFEAAYPNPFGDSVTISLGVGAPAGVRVELFDMLGRMVGEVAELRLGVGTHTVEYNPGVLTDGVYFLRIQSGGRSFSRPIVRSRP